MKYHKIINVFLFICLFNKINGQDLCKKKDKILEDKEGFVSIGSTVFDGFEKKGIKFNLTEFSCRINYDDPLNLIYTIRQQSDIIYFEAYYDTLHVKIKEQGYYRLSYLNNEIGYCWVKDLVWNFYDKSGSLLKKEYYDRDSLIKSFAK